MNAARNKLVALVSENFSFINNIGSKCIRNDFFVLRFETQKTVNPLMCAV